MTNRLRGTASLLATTVLALTLAACGSDDPGSEPAPPSSTTTSDGDSGDPSAEQEAAAHEPVDPCSLLSEDEREQVTGVQEISYVGKSLSPSETLVMECTLIEPDESLALLRFGYGSAPSLDYSEDLEYDAEQGAALTELPGVGDRAVVVRDEYQLDAWASLGRYTVFLSSSWHDADDATVTALLGSMLARTAPGMLEHPTILPDACPPATAARVVGVVGKVQRAIGSADDRHVQCQYASKRKVLQLGAYPSTREHIQQKTGGNDPYAGLASEDQETFSYRPGSLTNLTPSETGPYSFTYLRRPPRVITSSVDSARHFGSLSSFPRFDTARFRTLDRWWATSQIERLQR